MKNIDTDRYMDFKEAIKDEKKFYLEGWERIEKYYEIQDKERRYKETDLKNPPHNLIKESAKDFILLSTISIIKNPITGEYELRSNDDEYRLCARADTSNVLMGIGMELLLKSIILKTRPKIFIDYVKEKDDHIKTPSFNKCIEITCDLLKEVLDEKQLERIKDVLTLISIRRNELVHLHFHQQDHYATPHQIFNVLEFLFSYYFPEEKEFISWLSKKKEKNKASHGMDFEPVEFPILKGG